MSRISLLATTAVAPALWGTTYLVTTELLPEGKPLTAAAIRALPVGVILIASTRRLPRGDWWWKSAVLGTLNIGAFFALLFVAAYRLPGGVAATLSAVHPLVVAALAVAVLHEGSRLRTLGASALGLMGVAMLVLTPGAQLDAWGAVAAVAAGSATAVGVVLTKRWGTPVGLAPFTGWQLAWGGLLLLPVALATEGLPAALTATNIGGFAWLAIAGGLVAYLLWFRGVLALPATQVSLLTFLAPLTATLLGFFIAGETLTAVQLVGAVVVVVAVAVGQGIFTRTPVAPPVVSHYGDHARDDKHAHARRTRVGRAREAGTRTHSVLASRHARVGRASTCDASSS